MLTIAIIQRGLLTLSKNPNLVLADFYFGQILRLPEAVRDLSTPKS